jgi:16S rRNA (uracil1498-N3)-methyltransferase
LQTDHFLFLTIFLKSLYYHGKPLVHSRQTMPRFYSPPPLPLGGIFYLPPNAAHHASRVLRLRVGDAVEIFDGIGNECRGRIIGLSDKCVTIGDINASSEKRESPIRVLLAQALSGSEKMDWIIQKSTEMGVTEIQPLATERSVAKLPVERANKRLEHWRQVAISACEQCGRNVLPGIYVPMDIMLWLEQTKLIQDAKYILLPGSKASLHDQAKPKDKAILLIGSEGGFSEAESTAALQCGYIPIRLGTRVMRTETAAIAGIAAIQTLWGDF